MPRLKKPVTAKPDVLEVIHHDIPDTAAGAGAAPIAPRSYKEGGMTWRRMLRAVAIAEAAGFAALMVAGTLYGLSFFPPLAVAAVLHAVAAVLLPRMSKASAVYSLVVCSLTLLMFGVMFYGWAGFKYPNNWFEMTWGTLTVLIPIAGITAAIATLRHKNGTDAAKTPSRVVAAVSAVIVVVGVVGSATASDATRLPGDITLTAADMKFTQETLTAKAGDIAIYFENDDPFAHNVKIDGHGTSSDASGRIAIRHVFKSMGAGSYEYYCAIHPDMKGNLTVT